MYAKLVFRNAKRSVKDYLVYIVTMTICVTLFYAFLSISSSYYSPDIGSEYGTDNTVPSVTGCKDLLPPADIRST